MAAIPGYQMEQKVHQAVSKRKSPRTESFQEKIAFGRLASSVTRTLA